MASGETLGASFSIDVTDLKTGLNQANRLIRESESEFKAAAAGMDDWRTESAGLEAKIKSLNSITEIQKVKVKALQTEYDNLIAKGMDPASREAVEYREKINNETAALRKNEAELKKQEKALENVGNANKSVREIVYDQEQQLKKLEKEYKKVTKAKGKDSDEAKDLKNRIDELNGELSENRGKLEDVKPAAEDAGEGFSGLKAAGGIAAGAVAAVAAACVAAVTAFFGLAESTREARQNMAKLETAFSSAGLSAEQATSTYEDLYGILGDDGAATETAQTLAKISSDEEDLAANTRILTGVMAEWGESIPLNSLAEGMASTAAMGEVQGTLADALEWQGVNLEEYNAQLATLATEEERAAFIQQTLTELYGESADAYRENNAAVIEAQEAQAGLNDALNELGAIAEPIMTTLKTMAADALSALTPFVGMMGEGLAGALEGNEGAADSLASGLTGIIDTLLAMAMKALPVIISTVISLVPKLLTSLLGQLPSILATLLQMVAQVATALGGMLPTLIPVIIDCVLSLADTIIDNIDMIIDAAIALMIGLADGLVAALPKLVAKAPILIEKLITAILNNLPKLFQASLQIMIKLGEGLIKAIPQLVSKIPQIVNTLVTGIGQAATEIYSVGKNIVTGLWNGINDMAAWLADKLRTFCANSLDAILKFFDVRSPSRVMADLVGKNLALGIGKGFEENIDGVNDTIIGSMEDITSPVTVNASGKARGAKGGGVVVNQTNYYSQQHSRYELYKSKQQTAAAVRLAMGA